MLVDGAGRQRVAVRIYSGYCGAFSLQSAGAEGPELAVSMGFTKLEELASRLLAQQADLSELDEEELAERARRAARCAMDLLEACAHQAERAASAGLPEQGGG